MITRQHFGKKIKTLPHYDPNYGKMVYKGSRQMKLAFLYGLVGEAAHEWIGIGMFLLFIFHHILNGSWSRNILKGRYSPVRVMQTGLVILILCAMIGSMVSGVILSRYVLAFLPIKGGLALARNLHMICAYWGFVLMSVHLGSHWSIVLGMAKKFWGNHPRYGSGRDVFWRF